MAALAIREDSGSASQASHAAALAAHATAHGSAK
jgi:hypothetical protein